MCEFSQEQQYHAGLNVQGVIPTTLAAIVGTRSPSPEALEAAFTVARLLAGLGIGVVSGLALGIDGAAHRGCLAGGGKTVAVLGHGLDRPIYPSAHANLAELIAQDGALVSPYPAQESLRKEHLLARNRWIATLARVVWVVQTGMPGGALAAAAHARRQGIPVLTSPWTDPHWQLGYESLLKHGAESIDVLSVTSRLQYLCTQPIDTPLQKCLTI